MTKWTTSTAAVRRFRERKKAAGLKEIRGIYAAPKNEDTIKEFARRIGGDGNFN